MFSEVDNLDDFAPFGLVLSDEAGRFEVVQQRLDANGVKRHELRLDSFGPVLNFAGLVCEGPKSDEQQARDRF